MVSRAEREQGGESTGAGCARWGPEDSGETTCVCVRYCSQKDAGSAERTKDWVFQQERGSVRPPSASPAACGPWRAEDGVLSKLYLISSKVRSMASQPAGR